MGNSITKITKITKKNGKKSNDSNAEDAKDTNIPDREEFRYVDGRRFHNVESAKYPVPNDDDECDRLHMQHFIIRYAWQSNFCSPVEHILNNDDSKVLDVGYVSL